MQTELEKELVESLRRAGFERVEVDKSKLTHMGSMNYILQIFSSAETDEVTVDQYQPRRNKVWSGTMTKEELRPQVEETIERMKIAIGLFQDYLDGKTDTVYYWEREEDKNL